METIYDSTELHFLSTNKFSNITLAIFTENVQSKISKEFYLEGCPKLVKVLVYFGSRKLLVQTQFGAWLGLRTQLQYKSSGDLGV